MSEMVGEESAYSLPHLQCLKGTPCTESKRTLVHVTDSARGQDVQDDVVRRRPKTHRPDTVSRSVFFSTSSDVDAMMVEIVARTGVVDPLGETAVADPVCAPVWHMRERQCVGCTWVRLSTQ